MTAKSFYTTHKPHFSLLCTASAIADIFKTKEEDRPTLNAEQIQLVCSESVTCESMFGSVLLAVNRVGYRNNIRKRLRDVEHEDYSDMAVSSFTEACSQAVKNLQKNGAEMFDKVISPVLHLAKEVGTQMTCLHSEWRKGLSSSKKTAYVNSGKAPFLPWEGHCYEVGKIPGAPEAGSPPDDSMCKIMGCREQILEFVDGIFTLKGWKKEIDLRKEQLKKLDPDVDVDIEFLNEHAEPIMLQIVKDEVLGTLPTADDRVELNAVTCARGFWD